MHLALGSGEVIMAEKNRLYTICLLIPWISTSNALTLSPSSVAACDGELVVFTCTVNVRVIVWSITTPTRNYGPLAAVPSDVGRTMPFTTRDGVFKYGATSFINSSTVPVELVSTLTTTATRSLDGTVVQCEGGGGGRSVTANITFIRDPTSFNLTLPHTSNLEFRRTSISAINVSWTPQDGVNYVVVISPPIQYNNASRTSITIPNVPINTQYNITVGAINRCGNYTASTSLNYTHCVLPSISPRVRLVPNVVGVASAPEGTVISLSCISVNQVLVGVESATCIGNIWSPDIDGVICRGVCGLPVLADGLVVIDNFTATFEGSSFNFTCTDGLSPTAIIRTDCTAEGHWRPDPATHVCINISVTTTTEGKMMVSTTVVTVVCSIVFFIVGVVGGFAGGMYCNSKCQSVHQKNQASQPPPAPLY